MSVLTRKIGTLSRVVRRHGVSGMVFVLKSKATPVIRPPIAYARLAPSALTLLARHGRPDLLINAIGAGIGDDLLCTAIFRELRRRGRQQFWVTNKHPELYRHNADVSVVAPPLDRYDVLLKQLGVKVVYPWYTSYHPAYDRDDPLPEQHLISVMCQRAGITGEIALRPYLTLSDDELQRGAVARRQIAIQSAGLDAKHAMRNKNWYPDRYQSVVSALKSKYDFVQVGSRTDPPLEGAIDLRGKTTIRETAAVLARSLAFVGQVGMLMHLARAIDCRSVVVYGGRETPAQSGYPCNENLYSPVHCSPCWLLNACPYDRMCLQMVGVAEVVDAIERQVERYGEPLACDTDTITPAQIERSTARYEEASAAHKAAWAVLAPSMLELSSRAAPSVADDTAPSSPPVVYPSVSDGPDGRAPVGVLRVHRTLRGRGQVYDGDRVLADIEYSLKDAEEIVYETAPGVGTPVGIPGQRTIYGLANSLPDGVLGDYVGARLQLRLRDGGQLPFTVAKVLQANLFLIQGLGRVA